MMQLIPMTITLVVTIVVVLALFSAFPTLVAAFECVAIQGDDNGDFQITGAENSTDSTMVQAWKSACNTIQTQTTIVPLMIGLAIIIGAILIVTKPFS